MIPIRMQYASGMSPTPARLSGTFTGILLDNLQVQLDEGSLLVDLAS